MDDEVTRNEEDTSQTRECLINLEGWQAMKSSIAADHSGASAANGEPTSV